MTGWIIAAPGSGEAGTDARLARLEAAGWRRAALPGGLVAALRGRAECHAAGGWTVLGLATLDNRAEIAARAGLDPEGCSDMALLAGLIAAEGADFPDAVAGGFALVAIPDGGAALGWRDHFGQIPFFHATHEGRSVWSSDPRAALHLSALPLAHDPVRIADFLAGEDVDPTLTAFAGLARLPAGHRVALTPGGAEVTRYWQAVLPDPIPADGAPEGLRGRLETAAAASLGTPGEQVGAMLSGGLDSSSLTGLAATARARAGEDPLPTLSFVYGDRPYDESVYIAAANAQFHTAPTLIEIDAAPVLSEIGPLIEEQMDLFLAFGLQKSRRIYHEAAARGLTALIDGHGGDEVISHGYDRLYELAAEGRWGTLRRELRGTTKLHGSPFWSPYLSLAARYGGLGPRHPLRRVLQRLARMAARREARSAAARPPEHALIAADLRDRIGAETRYADPPPPEDRAACRDRERRTHLRLVVQPLGERAFETLFASAGAAGIAPRYPFYDRRLVRYCLSMPAEVKLRDGQTRWALRAAMAGLLPERIRTRTTKADFSAEFRETVLGHLDAAGIPDWAGLETLVETGTARRTCEAALAGRSADGTLLRMVWRLLLLALWQEAFLRWQALQTRGELV